MSLLQIGGKIRDTRLGLHQAQLLAHEIECLDVVNATETEPWVPTRSAKIDQQTVLGQPGRPGFWTDQLRHPEPTTPRDDEFAKWEAEVARIGVATPVRYRESLRAIVAGLKAAGASSAAPMTLAPTVKYRQVCVNGVCYWVVE